MDRNQRLPGRRGVANLAPGRIDRQVHRAGHAHWERAQVLRRSPADTGGRSAPPNAEIRRMGIATRKTIDEADLRRDVIRDEAAAGSTPEHRCHDCGRAPLIGESVAHYGDGALRCDLCRSVHREQPTSESLVKHAPDGPRSRVRVIRRLPV